MACRKYILTNNTTSNGVFSYQECSNQMLINDLVIEPNVTLNIWLTTGTYRSATPGNITIQDLGAFPFPPPASPTPTPSITASATVTPTVTPTDNVTDTPTPTPTTTPTPSVSSTQTATPTPTETPTNTPTTTLTPTPSTTPPIQGFFFTLQEVGPDVVLSGTGSANLSSLTPSLLSANPGFINPSQGLFCVGSAVNEEVYTGASLSTPPFFGSGNFISADSNTGNIFGTDGFGDIKVPQGYTGGLLNGTATFTGTTLSTLGAVVGTYITQWGSSGATETLTLNVI